MSTESCYGRAQRLQIKLAAWFSDVILPYVSMRVFSWFFQLSLGFNMQVLRLTSLIKGKPLPPNFNTNFEHVLPHVKPDQVKWLTEARSRQKDDPVILYFHGGGYGMSSVPVQIETLRDLHEGADNSRLSALILDYTTTYYAPYPTQLCEAIEVYNALATTSNNIILLGDSAGGHLALQLMRHIAVPDKELPRVTQKPTAFLGISPSLDMYVHPDVTTHRNSQHDLLSVHMMRGWSEMYASDELRVGPKIRLLQDKNVDWNAALPPPSRVFISYGGRELLIDGILTFLTENDLVAKGATVYSHPLDVHDSLMMIGAESPIMKPAIEFLKTLA